MGTTEYSRWPLEFKIFVRDFRGNQAAPMVVPAWKVRVHNYHDLVTLQGWGNISGWTKGDAVLDEEGNVTYLVGDARW